MAFSQSGNEEGGKNALLMNITGRVRKLTMATSESMLLTDNAKAVKMKESPRPRKMNAPNIPIRLRTLNELGSWRPFGMINATTNVSTPSTSTLTRF